MVWDKPKGKQLNKLDWLVLGHDLFTGEGKAVLPSRRLDIPMPHSADGLHTLAHRLAGLSQALHGIAREGETLTSPRLAIGDAQSQIWLLHQDFKRLRKEWERELRASLEGEGRATEKPVHLRPIG